ncbi:unnamed protein product [Brassica rapa]|uniref:Uncharacterized protein n=1 Tax=Brassica campestris TaxID=3711 RepID=A0A8D9GRZ3_BRACM|nr:unnamed protein product [Brassica rapa]
MFYTPRFIAPIFSIIRFPEIDLPPNDMLLLCLAGDVGGKDCRKNLLRVEVLTREGETHEGRRLD